MALVVRNSLFPSLLREFLGSQEDNTNGVETNVWYSEPRHNIIEFNDHYMVELALPGIEKDQVKIDLENQELTISSNKEWRKNKDAEYLRKEFQYGVFKKSFVLPDTIDVDNVSAHMDLGILRLKLMKKEEAKEKPAREIKIS